MLAGQKHRIVALQGDRVVAVDNLAPRVVDSPSLNTSLSLSIYIYMYIYILISQYNIPCLLENVPSCS